MKNTVITKRERSAVLPAALLAVTVAVMSTVGHAGDAGSPATCVRQDTSNDLWTVTRLETTYLLNPHLNAFTIRTRVEEGEVTLSGTVRSEVDRDLAEEIARSIDGVRSVNNDLEVDENLEAADQERVTADRNFMQKVSDATTTARVKVKLMANRNISGSDIDVDTRGQVVQLSGSVASAAQRDLAAYIARNTHGVKRVNNEIDVVNSG